MVTNFRNFTIKNPYSMAVSVCIQVHLERVGGGGVRKMIEQVDVGKDNEQVFAMATRIESEPVWQQWTCLFL